MSCGGGAMAADELDLNAVEAALAMLDGDPMSALACRASCSEPSMELGTQVGDSFFSIDHAQGVCTTTTRTEGATQASSKPKRKRIRDPTVDVRRRARRRQERQELQREVESYEQQLKTLVARAVAKENKEPVEEIDAADEDELKMWKGVAREQIRHRAASEELNRQLKSKLVAHYDVSKRMGQLLIELASHHEKGKLPSVASGHLFQHSACCFSTMSECAIVPSNREHLMAEARKMLRDAYLSTDSVFASFMTVTGMINATELFSTSRIRQDEPGPCMELLTSTPMPCGLHETVEIVWNWLKWKRRSNIIGFNYSCVTRQVTDLGIEVQHDVQFSGPFDAETFHGVTAMEKHEEADRMVLVFATKTVQAAGTVEFYEKGWILVSRSPVDPLHNSVVRTCFRVVSGHAPVDITGGVRADVPDDRAFRGFVQRKIVKRMDTRLKELQRELLRETGRHDLEALIDI